MQNPRMAAAGAAFLALTLGIATAQPALALPSPSASIVDSECSITYRWQGAVTPGSGYPQGTVKFCAYKYRLADKDKNGDYYAVVAQSVWTFSGNQAGNEAPMSQSIKSNTGSIDNVYSATKSYTSSASCSTPVTLSVSLGVFSVSTEPKLCSGYKFTRSVSSSTRAVWSSNTAGGLRNVATSFNQKVAEGKTPTYTVVFSMPQYSIVDAPAPYYVKSIPLNREITFTLK